jgi:hypothetical protein
MVVWRLVADAWRNQRNNMSGDLDPLLFDTQVCMVVAPYA